MHKMMQLYWKLYNDKYSNEDIIHSNYNPIREYEDELIEGPVIDIGCGQSNILLEFAATPRIIFALDNEHLQLTWLKNRAIAQPGVNLNNWHFIHASFPDNPLPDQQYALVVLSNFLHFFSLPKCIDIGSGLLKNTLPGSLIYVNVHSHRHYVNKPNNPERYNYFKHYFTIRDLEQIFPPKSFERIYLTKTDKRDSAASIAFTNHWIDEWHNPKNAKEKANVEEIKRKYFANKSQSDITVIFRRR